MRSSTAMGLHAAATRAARRATRGIFVQGENSLLSCCANRLLSVASASVPISGVSKEEAIGKDGRKSKMAGAEAVLTNYPDVRASSASAERQQVALTSTHRQKHAAGQMGSPKSASKAVAKTLAQSPAPRTSQPPRTASKPPQYDEGSRKLAALGLGMLVLMVRLWAGNTEPPSVRAYWLHAD